VAEIGAAANLPFVRPADGTIGSGGGRFLPPRNLETGSSEAGIPEPELGASPVVRAPPVERRLEAAFLAPAFAAQQFFQERRELEGADPGIDAALRRSGLAAYQVVQGFAALAPGVIEEGREYMDVRA
jgi:hypothetical protein